MKHLYDLYHEHGPNIWLDVSGELFEKRIYRSRADKTHFTLQVVLLLVASEISGLTENGLIWTEKGNWKEVFSQELKEAKIRSGSTAYVSPLQVKIPIVSSPNNHIHYFNRSATNITSFHSWKQSGSNMFPKSNANHKVY